MDRSSAPLEVLFEDNHLLVVNKPAMLPTMGVEPSRPSLLEVAREYVRQKYHKPGKVYLGIVSRLDAPVSGVVLLARTSKAASRLSEAFRQRRPKKIYWATVSGHLERPEATLEHYLRKDERHRRVHVTHADAPDARLARLHYSVRAEHFDFSLLQVELETGRKHQIRVQLAKLGHPILGDRKYGSSEAFPVGIALHSRQLELEHPVGGGRLSLEAPLPASWSKHPATNSLVKLV